MTALLLLVLFSPTLTFNHLTLVDLAQWLNVHPFWTMFLLGAVFKTDFVSIVRNYDKKWW